LPPVGHLLNWAADIFDEHLRRLANPHLLPPHPWLEDDRLALFLLQEHGRHYESMLMGLVQLRLREDSRDYRVRTPLRPLAPSGGATAITQGHYRVGARDDPAAYDNELPPQAVELSSFRIAAAPVSNAEFLAFMQAGGYQNPDAWSAAGWAWRQAGAVEHPDHWRRDPQGQWYGVGVQGPGDLSPEAPVMGIGQHEAHAYANWVGSLGGILAGAVLQHEYQWEVAVRTGAIAQRGRAWEWCANPLHAYPEFRPFPDENTSWACFDGRHCVLRGGSLHTQPGLRRISLRNWGLAGECWRFAGTRLVFPPLG
jgi:gamma-glutamyl hercynylcysteine S-oxide synthase